MRTTLTLTTCSFLAALLTACGASNSASQTPESCPPGFVWTGTKCEDRRSIIIEEGAPKPAPTTSGSTSVTPPPAPAP